MGVLRGTAVQLTASVSMPHKPTSAGRKGEVNGNASKRHFVMYAHP